MRNLFDQYAQPENKLTHALVCTLQLEPKLIHPFLKELLKIDKIPQLRRIKIVEQQVPGEAVSGNEEESKGLPDAWFYGDLNDNSSWAVFVESKIQAGIGVNQLERHARTAERCGYAHYKVVLIAVDQPNRPVRSRLSMFTSDTIRPKNHPPTRTLDSLPTCARSYFRLDRR